MREINLEFGLTIYLRRRERSIEEYQTLSIRQDGSLPSTLARFIYLQPGDIEGYDK